MTQWIDYYCELCEVSKGVIFQTKGLLFMHEYKTVSVTSIMTPTPLETANLSDNVDTIIRTMTVKNKSSIIILNELKHPEGIITERDIVRRLVFESKDTKLTQASEIMSSPLISLNDDATIYDAAMVMSRHSIRRLPIMKDNVLLGIVTATDFVRKLYQGMMAACMQLLEAAYPETRNFLFGISWKNYVICTKKHTVTIFQQCLR
jgi:signal-transduction protein with cAMP-binding, CBS, and nucleotidyltransferase domain